ncbi:MAG TPA: 50S ribosomal protein L9 [bacterium]|nr:50S ribosomal protein L9 [bacterium]HOL48149.1 50S ribosomal protein L9 [bacterium]HPQ18495.1 50S ribosomal protein L9 [bacterium]
MEVILLDDVKKLGKFGDIVKVKDGFARNYLLPNNLALIKTEGNLKKFEEIKKVKIKKMKMSELKAKELAETMAAMVLTIKRKAGEDGKIFGSVSEKDIIDALKEKGITIENKKQIKFKDHIKILGNYEVDINLFQDIKTTIKLIVEKE